MSRYKITAYYPNKKGAFVEGVVEWENCNADKYELIQNTPHGSGIVYVATKIIEKWVKEEQQ